MTSAKITRRGKRRWKVNVFEKIVLIIAAMFMLWIVYASLKIGMVR